MAGLALSVATTNEFLAYGAITHCNSLADCQYAQPQFWPRAQTITSIHGIKTYINKFYHLLCYFTEKPQQYPLSV